MFTWVTHYFNKIGNVRVNATSRRGCETIAAVEKHHILHILSVCL